jgi:hypothetical protein
VHAISYREYDLRKIVHTRIVHNSMFLVNGRDHRFHSASFQSAMDVRMNREGKNVLATVSIYSPSPNRYWGRNVRCGGRGSIANALGLAPLVVSVVVLNCACVRNKGTEESVGDGSISRSAVRVEGGASSLALSATVKVREAPVGLRKTATESVDRTHVVSDLCGGICERSRKLRCKNAAECERNCQAMGLIAGCNEQMLVLYRCLGGQAVDRWECAEDGVAAIRDGFCEAEQEKAVACVEMKTK